MLGHDGLGDSERAFDMVSLNCRGAACRNRLSQRRAGGVADQVDPRNRDQAWTANFELAGLGLVAAN